MTTARKAQLCSGGLWRGGNIKSKVLNLPFYRRTTVGCHCSWLAQSNLVSMQTDAMVVAACSHVPLLFWAQTVQRSKHMLLLALVSTSWQSLFHFSLGTKKISCNRYPQTKILLKNTRLITVLPFLSEVVYVVFLFCLFVTKL